MAILDGFKKVKRYVKENDGYKLMSQWTKSETVEMSDGTDLQTDIDAVKSNINTKAPLASPTLTGTPNAPTATDGTNTTQIATTAFVQNAVKNKVDKVDGKNLSTNDYTTAEKTKLSGIATGAEVNQNAFSNIVVGSTTIVADTKTDSLTLVGSNVTLTPDATNDKVTIGVTSSNVTTALGYTPLNPNIKGVASGLAELDSSGKVPSSQLPSYVDDVLEYSAKSSFPATGETGKIYVDKTTNLTYRWSGSAYVEISPSLALGETSSTAYRGDRGKIAYDHSQSAHAPSNAEVNQNAFSTIAVSSGGLINLPANQKQDTLTLASGSNVSIEADATTNKLTITAIDTKATQTNTTTDADYRVVLSTNANDTTETNTLRKSSNFTANPSTGMFGATSYKIDDKVTLTYNSTTESLDFTFI